MGCDSAVWNCSSGNKYDVLRHTGKDKMFIFIQNTCTIESIKIVSTFKLDILHRSYRMRHRVENNLKCQA